MGLEVVVRPLIFPDIRPRPRPALPPQDDPTKGFAVIQGNPTVSTSGSLSVSVSSSQTRPVESSRRVDEVTVYQKDKDGKVNKENFVDLQIANKITMKEPGMGDKGFTGFNGDDTVATVPGRGFTGDDIEREHFYAPVKEEDNIKIKKKNKVIKAKEK